MRPIQNVVAILGCWCSICLLVAGPNLPLSFEMNRGQSTAQTRFVSRADGYALCLTDSEAVFSFRGNSDVVRMKLSGGNRAVRVRGTEPLTGVVNYLVGRDRSKWLTNIPTYARVQYAEVYPGIELTYYGNQRQLEYDFTVAPGANPERIRIQFADVRTLRVNRQGDLVVLAKHGRLVFHRPVVYQRSGNGRLAVDGHFRLLDGKTAGFRLGAYDQSKELVIDPTLSYGTYVGGAKSGIGGSSSDATISAIAADAEGNAYITGYTVAADFPATAGAFQTGMFAGKRDAPTAFVTKLNASGSALVYSTFLGGGRSDKATGVAVDAAGNAYVGGTTQSADFPTTQGTFQSQAPFLGAQGSHVSGFVTKLSADGTSLVYSTYLGASGSDAKVHGIALDGAGEVFATGNSNVNFPTTAGAFQTAPPGVKPGFPFPWPAMFVAKLNATGTALVYSTFIDGTQAGDGTRSDLSTGVAIDKDGNAYIAGRPASTDFPVTAGAYQVVHPGIFITKLSPSGGALVYSAFLGGSGADVARAIAVDPEGAAYVVGSAGSRDFPVTPGAFQTKPSPGAGFLTKLSADGTALVYSTYLTTSIIAGGSVADGVAVDNSGNAYVIGTVGGNVLQVTSDALQKSTPNTSRFFVEMNPAGNAAVYSTYLGNTGSLDPAFAIAIDSKGGAYLAGSTYSHGFPVTTGAFKAKHASAAPFDGYVAKFSATPSSAPVIAAVVNGASSQAGICPGGFATIYGNNLSPVTDQWGNYIVNGALPTAIQGVSVTVGGKPAYLSYISPGQINFMAPQVGNGSKAVIVTGPNGSSASFTTTSKTYAPAFFLLPGNQVLATHLDYTLAVKAGTYPFKTAPAKPGEIVVLWGTTFGPTNPAEPDGTVVPSGHTYSTTTLPSVNISKYPATVYGAALTPGLAGVYQVGVKVPEALADGDWPVVAMIGGVSSEAGIVITVQK